MFSISKALAPSPEVREGLARRSALVGMWLASSGIDAIRPHIDLMLGTLRFQNESESDAEVRKRAYYLAMCDLPPFAVQAACASALRGKVGTSDKWAPQPGELYTAAIAAMRELEREKRDIDAVLKAEVVDKPEVSAEERAAMVARVEADRAKVVASAAMVSADEIRRQSARRRDCWDHRREARKDIERVALSPEVITKDAAERRLAAMPYANAPCALTDEARERFIR